MKWVKCPFCDYTGSPDEVDRHIEETVEQVMGSTVADLVREIHREAREKYLITANLD